MPCTYTGSIEGDKIQSLGDALDIRERMLCALAKHLELKYGEAKAKSFMVRAANRQEGLDSDDIVNWWNNHKEAES